MRILMLAPQPFFRPRGTPFSVLQRVKGLVALGHTVDLVTYPFGEDVSIPGLIIHRTAAPPGVRDVPIGPSISKLLLDVPFFLASLRFARTGRFDVLHTHEEAATMGAWISRRYGLPHIYDMHSSLPEQFANFGKYNWRPVVRLFRWMERYTLDRSDLLITVCPALDQHAQRVGFPRPMAMIENTLEVLEEEVAEAETEALRRELRLEGKRVVVYTGTLEQYQGLETLLRSIPMVAAQVPDAHFLVVGGTPEQSAALAVEADALGVGSHLTALPAVAPERVAVHLSVASALVTCRTRGINTPLKIYQYLRAGRPIVATDIRSHTQVLDQSTAELVEPSPEGVAAGLIRVLTDPGRADALAQAANRAVAERYNARVYMSRLWWLMENAETLASRSQDRDPGSSPVRTS